MISAGVQDKLARVEEIRAQIDELEAELEQIFGAVPAEIPEERIFPTRKNKEKAKKTKKWNPASKPAADHPYRRASRKVEYDLEGVKTAIRAGKKPNAIADEFGIETKKVYQARANMMRAGETIEKVAAVVPREEATAAPASPAMKRDAISADEFKEVKKLFHEGRKLTSEIAHITGLDGEEVNIAVQANAYGMYIFNRKRK